MKTRHLVVFFSFIFTFYGCEGFFHKQESNKNKGEPWVRTTLFYNDYSRSITMENFSEFINLEEITSTFLLNDSILSVVAAETKEYYPNSEVVNKVTINEIGDKGFEILVQGDDIESRNFFITKYVGMINNLLKEIELVKVEQKIVELEKDIVQFSRNLDSIVELEKSGKSFLSKIDIQDQIKNNKQFISDFRSDTFTYIPALITIMSDPKIIFIDE